MSQTRFDILMQTYASQAGGYAAAAATSASIAENYATSLTSFSTSSILISLGILTFITQSGKLYAPGQFVVIAEISNPTINWMYGQVSSYSGTNLVVNITDINGTGTYADWNISLCGVPGATGGAPEISGISNTSLTIDTSGEQTIITNTGLAFSTNQFILVTSTVNSTNWMFGTVVSYNESTGLLILNIQSAIGSGTFNSWTISLSGPTGPEGYSGGTIPIGAIAPSSPVANSTLWVDTTDV